MTRFAIAIAALLGWCVAGGIAPAVHADEPVEPAQFELQIEPAGGQGHDDDGPTDDSPFGDFEDGLDGDARQVEVIRERYDDGSVKIEREVTQDAEGNYVNHGSWKMWDTRGTLIGEGRFRNNKRHGTWNRWYAPGSVDLLNKAPYNAFTGPFVSQATFRDGQLHGKWIVYDAKLRKAAEWEFVSGQRHGKSVWWFASGHPMREIDYADGLIDGNYFEWNADGKLLIEDSFQQGRKLASKTTQHPGGQKRTEGMYLFARLVIDQPDDWWSLKPAKFKVEGADERHGPWTAWYPNGQKQLEGEYKHDVAVGKFTWWYATGQKAVEGSHQNGAQHGKWTWWHENGQKASEGTFDQGDRAGQWVWWQGDGKVSRKAQFSTVGGVPTPVERRPDREATTEPPRTLQAPLPLKR